MEIKTYEEWKSFCAGKPTLSVYLTAEEIFSMSPMDKELTWREKVTGLFAEKNVEITRYRHNYKTTIDEEYWGLVTHRTDSEITERMEITAIIGVNARWADAVTT